MTEKPKRPGTFEKGDPRIKRTGTPGSGRRPDRFKRMCQRYTLTALRTKVRRILRDPDHQHFMAAVRWASEHGYGKPSQRIEVDHRLTLEDLITASREGEEEQE